MLGNLFGAVLPVFGLMGTGLVARRVRWLTEEADQSLLRICVSVLLPALIFDSVLGNEALKRPENILLPPLVAVVMVLIGIGLSWLVAECTGLESPRERRTFALTTGLQNYGYIPLPLCVLLFDTGTVGVLLVHNLGVELVLWTVGVAILSGDRWSSGWKRAFNAPSVALLVALTLNGLGHFISPPGAVLAVGRMIMTGLHWLGECAVPMALLMIGAIIADHLSEMHGGRFARVVAAAIGVRLLVMPLLFFLLAKLLPCSVELKRVIVVEGSMASAVLPVALTKHYGGDPRIALQVVLGTSLVGLATIPIWIRFGGHIAGLW